MDKLPRKQQEYFQRIRQALGEGDESAFADLVRQKNPLAIREDLVNVLGQHTLENYDEPLNVFNDKKLLENIPTEYTKMPKGIAAQYDPNTNGILMPKANPDLANKQAGLIIHEGGHKMDALKGFDASEPFDPKFLKKYGAEAAEDAFGKHHSSGFFEKEALMKLLKNKKLSSAVLPVLKGLPIAGALYGMSQGDAFAADPTGMLQTDELGAGSDILPPEEMIKRTRFNKLKQKLLNNQLTTIDDTKSVKSGSALIRD